MVSTVQLRNLRLQFPIGLVRGEFHVRAVSGDSVSNEASFAVSATPGQASCT